MRNDTAKATRTGGDREYHASMDRYGNTSLVALANKFPYDTIECKKPSGKPAR